MKAFALLALFLAVSFSISTPFASAGPLGIYQGKLKLQSGTGMDGFDPSGESKFVHVPNSTETDVNLWDPFREWEYVYTPDSTVVYKAVATVDDFPGVQQWTFTIKNWTPSKKRFSSLKAIGVSDIELRGELYVLGELRLTSVYGGRFYEFDAKNDFSVEGNPEEHLTPCISLKPKSFFWWGFSDSDGSLVSATIKAQDCRTKRKISVARYKKFTSEPTDVSKWMRLNLKGRYRFLVSATGPWWMERDMLGN